MSELVMGGACPEKLKAVLFILFVLLTFGKAAKDSAEDNKECRYIKSFDGGGEDMVCQAHYNTRQSSGTFPLKDSEMERLLELLRDSPTRPPIFLFPGLGSTRLVAWKKKECRYSKINIRDNVWFSPGKLLETMTIDPDCWLDCLKLGPNQTDPDDCKVRAEQGLQAISVLSPGPIIGGATAVYSALIDWLADRAGYDPGQLLAFPYDWRLSPGALERRDGLFSRIQGRIEEAVRRAGRPGVFVGHSMGNLLFLCFLDWLGAQPAARRGTPTLEEWTARHVWGLVGVGAPLLGAPGALKSVISGEDMGLPLSDRQAKTLESSFGSTHLINPKVPSRNGSITFCHEAWASAGADWPEDVVTVVSDRGAGAQRPLTFDAEAIAEGELFRWMGNLFDDADLKEKYHSLHRDYFNDQNFYDNTKPPSRPPIKHIIMLYGTNLQTAAGFVYQNKKSETQLILDEILYEKEGELWAVTYTKQKLEKKKGKGKSMDRFVRNSTFPKSGDGTVPYQSLAWAHTWMYEDNFQETKHPAMYIPSSKLPLLKWAPDKLHEAVNPSLFIPAFEVKQSFENSTGKSTIVIEIEGLEHKENTRDMFAITTIFEYLLPKMEKEMCLGGLHQQEDCKYGVKKLTSSTSVHPGISLAERGDDTSLASKAADMIAWFKEQKDQVYHKAAAAVSQQTSSPQQVVPPHVSQKEEEQEEESTISGGAKEGGGLGGSGEEENKEYEQEVENEEKSTVGNIKSKGGGGNTDDGGILGRIKSFTGGGGG